LKTIAHHLFAFFLHLGGFGLLGLGIFDSSFLFMPLGNDLLVIAMSAHKPSHMPYYALMSAAGSVIGCLLVDIVSRKGGEEGIEKHVSKKRLEYVKKKVKKSAGKALIFAALMPPPFPFTPFVIASAALQYPRKKLLLIIAITRSVRFLAEGFAAIRFGTRMLKIAENPVFIAFIVGLVVLCVAGSVLSILSWVRRSKKVAQPALEH
jgi:membrane protein YqaA with SNARE-associated domain